MKTKFKILGLSLTLGVICLLNKQFENKEKLYKIDDLLMISNTDILGNTNYHFVTDESEGKYNSITNPDITYQDTIPVLNETKYYWIPDILENLALIDGSSITNIAGFSNEENYTKNELEKIEDTISSFYFNPYLYLKESSFKIDNLFLVLDDYEISIYDKTFYLELNDNLEVVRYYYCLTDLKKGIKANVNNDNVTIKEVTTSYISNINKEHFVICDIKFFLNKDKLEKGIIHFSDIEELNNLLNPPREVEDNPQPYLLALKR